MTATPRWLRLVAGTTVAALLITVVQPAVGALVLRMFVLGAILVIGLVTVAEPLRRLAPTTGPDGRRTQRPPAAMPRELDAMARSLRELGGDDRVPAAILDPLRASLLQRLGEHHDPVAKDPAHAAAIRGRLSPDARALLAAGSGRTATISRDRLPALVAEIGSL